MAMFDNAVIIPPMKAVIFFIIDTSAAMAGRRIKELNLAMGCMLEKLNEMNADNSDIEFEAAILTYSNGAKWLTPDGPVKVKNYCWADIAVDGQQAGLGVAFEMLCEKLHELQFFPNHSS